MNEIPILKLGEWRFEKKLVEAFKQIGFVAIRTSELNKYIEHGYIASKSFFSMPVEYKMTHHVEGAAGQRGYTPFGIEKAKDQTTPDLKEFFQFAAQHNCTPDGISVLHYHAFAELFVSMDVLAQHLLNDIASVMKLDFTGLGNYHERDSILRAIHYPPTGPSPKGLRSAPHEDINLITLLPAASARGLEVLNHKGEWIKAPTDSDLIIVNVGDMLQEFTEGVLKSTTHRVVNTKEGEEFSRYSMPFFFHPQASFRLSSRYTAGEYLDQRLKEIGLKK